jgi:hypothetical protein
MPEQGDIVSAGRSATYRQNPVNLFPQVNAPFYRAQWLQRNGGYIQKIRVYPRLTSLHRIIPPPARWQLQARAHFVIPLRR